MSQRKLRPVTRLRTELKFLIGLTAVTGLIVALLIVLFQAGPKDDAKAAPFTESYYTGSYIIDMGVTPQTEDNALKPYGLIYELIDKHDVPVKWIINPTKARDGIDFTYNGVDYKAGPFLVEVEHIDSTIAALIATWNGMGVQGAYTTSNMTFPINYIRTIRYFPNILVDNMTGNTNIIINYYDNAGIDSLAYDIGTPYDLTACHDLWVNPHGDPEWATHGPLYNFATTQASHIWCQCHCASMLEGSENTSAPFERMNFLTTEGLKCWHTNGTNPAGKCGPSITETHVKTETGPYTHNHPTDPVMQFLGDIDNALNNGSEQWFQPQSYGAWRGTTKRCVTTSDGISPQEGVHVVYGPAFGNSNNGQVMYMGSHNLDANGTIQERVAAQRAFLNFNLLCGKYKELFISNSSIPNSYYQGQTRNVSVTVNSGYPPYSYQWSSNVGGVFANPNAASTTFTAPLTVSELDGIIKVVVTDACGRKNIYVVPINVFITGLPVELTEFSAEQNAAGHVELSWSTRSETNNDYFTLSRSKDGNLFTDIARISGAGTTTTTKHYSHVDHEPQTGNNYYRLQQTDYNGDTETFTTLVVNVIPAHDTNAAALLVAPNPFSHTFTVRFEAEQSSRTTLKLVDLFGKTLFAQQLDARTGINRFEFRIPDRIPKGNYVLQLWDRESVIGTVQVVHSGE